MDPQIVPLEPLMLASIPRTNNIQLSSLQQEPQRATAGHLDEDVGGVSPRGGSDDDDQQLAGGAGGRLWPRADRHPRAARIGGSRGGDGGGGDDSDEVGLVGLAWRLIEEPASALPLPAACHPGILGAAPPPDPHPASCLSTLR